MNWAFKKKTNIVGLGALLLTDMPSLHSGRYNLVVTMVVVCTNPLSAYVGSRSKHKVVQISMFCLQKTSHRALSHPDS